MAENAVEAGASTGLTSTVTLPLPLDDAGDPP